MASLLGKNRSSPWGRPFGRPLAAARTSEVMQRLNVVAACLSIIGEMCYKCLLGIDEK